MKRDNRIIVFVDGSNVFHALRRLNTKIDYYRLVNELVANKGVLVRSYFYTSTSVPPSPAQVRFHQALGHLGFTVVTRPIRARGEVWIEKGVDVALITDMLVMAFRNLYDTAILVSGDADYVGAVEEIRRLRKTVEVAAFQDTISQELRKSADAFVPLDGMIEKIALIARRADD